MTKETEKKILELTLFGQQTGHHAAVSHYPHRVTAVDALALQERLREIRRLVEWGES
jgi:hypothetical protein